MAHTLDPILTTLTPHQLWVATLFGEARGERVDGQVAVAASMRNRERDGRWGEGMANVLGAWAQYSCLWPTLGGGNYKAVLDFASKLTTDHTQTPVERQLEWVITGIESGVLMDPTGGATHYYSNIIPPPFWVTKDTKFCGQFGRHLFYSHVR